MWDSKDEPNVFSIIPQKYIILCALQNNNSMELGAKFRSSE